jgi:hypothetical protein
MAMPQPSSQSSTTSSNSLPGLLAALGGVAALIAFFALTYWGYTVSASGSSLGSLSGSATFKAVDFARDSTNAGLSNSSNISFILLWIVPVAGAIGLLIGGLRLLGQRIGGGAAAPLLLIAGIAGAGALAWNALYINSQTSGGNSSINGVNFSIGFGIGLWIALAGAVLVALGGLLSLGGNSSR